jgi:cytochrome c oxidase cbb3-type subunit 1
VVRALGGIMFLIGALVMVYNLVRTARGDLRVEKSYVAATAAAAAE